MKLFTIIDRDSLSVPDFFKHAQRRGEMLGLLTLKKSDLLFVESHASLMIKNFFETGRDRDPNIIINDVADYHTERVRDWQKYVETYCKYVWLLREYILNGGFNNYMGVHWNPEAKKWNIHPGGSRQIIHFLFGPDEEEFIGFNTGGYPVKWNKIYHTEEDLIQDFPTAGLALCNDYGTVIPHLHIDAATILPAVVKTHAHLVEFYNTTKICANFNLGEFGIYARTGDFKKRVDLTINENTVHAKTRALMLMPSFTTFNNYGIKIETTEY